MRLLVHEGAQYPEDRLPAGVVADGLLTVEEWFAANRSGAGHKAVLAPAPSPKPVAKKKAVKAK